MWKLLSSLVAFFILAIGNSQEAKEFRTHTPRMIAYGSLPKDDIGEDVQKNFISQTWRTGTVYFRSTSDNVKVPLIFDIYSNKLYFLRDGVIMEFTQPIKEFTISILIKEDTLSLLFRSAYPAIHKNTDDTFYEVLVDGNFQLLRCKAKTIGLYKDKDLPEEERNYTKELLYAFLPNGNMILVKKDKDYLLKEMAEYTVAIQKICSNEKLKLRNEAQLIDLFIALNK